MTESPRPLIVECHFCHESVLAIVCDKVILKKVINRQPRMVRDIEVYRCDDCNQKGYGK